MDNLWRVLVKQIVATSFHVFQRAISNAHILVIEVYHDKERLNEVLAGDEVLMTI